MFLHAVERVYAIGCDLTLDACLSRPMEFAGHDDEDQRVADRARLCHVV